MKSVLAITVACLAGLSSPAAMSATFSIAGTGTDASGNVLGGGSSDPHYTVTGPSVPVPAPAAVYSPAAIWWQWFPNNSTSAWIGFKDSFDSSIHGTYTYSVQFDLTGYDAATASLSGQWAADQYGSILLNGAGTGNSLGDGNWNGHLNAFTISSGFHSGVNVLSFAVVEPDDGDGLRVEPMTLTAAAVPEPSTWVLMAAGLFGAAIARPRRQS